MLGVLVVVFRRDRVAGGGRIARKLNVFLGNMIGGAPDFHVGPVQFVDARQRIVILASAASAARHDYDPACDGACFDRSSWLACFANSWLMTVSPPDVFDFSIDTLANSTSLAECSGPLSQQQRRRTPASRKRRADQRRRPFSTALQSLDLDTPCRAQPRICFGLLPLKAVKHSDQNRQFVNSFRSVCVRRVLVRFGPRLSPCPPQPLGAVLRASSRRPSGRFRSRKLVGLVPTFQAVFCASGMRPDHDKTAEGQRARNARKCRRSDRPVVAPARH